VVLELPVVVPTPVVVPAEVLEVVVPLPPLVPVPEVVPELDDELDPVPPVDEPEAVFLRPVNDAPGVPQPASVTSPRPSQQAVPPDIHVE
jgi:hypothetical protein